MPSSGPQRVQAALDARGLACRVVTLADSTRTSEEAAAAVGCSVAEIAKSMVFRGRDSDRPVLAVMSGVNRVDAAKLRRLLGERVERPDADFVRARTGYAIGGVPPLGHPEPLPTWIDEDLFAFERVWAAAGSPFSVFEIAPPALLAASGGARADLKAAS